MIAYALHRLARAALTALGLAVLAALLATSGAQPCGAGGVGGVGAQPCAPTAWSWLGAAARLDFGRTVDGQSVADAIAAALPASVILVAAAVLTTLLVGWGGGALLALAEQQARRRIVGAHGVRPWWTATRLDEPTMPRGRQGARRAPLQYVMRLLAALVEVCQGVPVFWLGGLLAALFAVGLGWLPPGGIAAPDLPAFGTAAYLDALAADPAAILGDLLGHLILPAVALALAGLATDLRLVATALPAELRAPHMRVAAGLGLSRQRLFWRAARPAGAAIIGGSAAGAPLLAGALVLVEYLFGWPGLGLLAFHAARAGDSATLAALLLLFGLVIVALVSVADLLAAWADPRLRGAPS